MTDMADPALYSRAVRVLKIALPLTALAILSVLFILAERLDPDAAIPYADVDVEQILRDQGMTRPSFGGLTEGGDVVSLTADSLRPEAGGGDAMTAAMLTAALDLAGGGRIDIDAPRGRVDMARSVAELTGGVTLRETGGHVVTTDAMTFDWNTGAGFTGPIEADGPDGRLTAGRMVMTRGAGGNRVLFDGGVHLLFYPDPTRKDDK